MSCLQPPETPWVLIHYPLSDEEVFANDGKGYFYLGCMVCHAVEQVDFTVPEQGSDKWLYVYRHGDPRVLASRAAFQFTHLQCGENIPDEEE